MVGLHWFVLFGAAPSWCQRDCLGRYWRILSQKMTVLWRLVHEYWWISILCPKPQNNNPSSLVWYPRMIWCCVRIHRVCRHWPFCRPMLIQRLLSKSSESAFQQVPKDNQEIIQVLLNVESSLSSIDFTWEFDAVESQSLVHLSFMLYLWRSIKKASIGLGHRSSLEKGGNAIYLGRLEKGDNCSMLQ